jgi:hypothetical protein
LVVRIFGLKTFPVADDSAGGAGVLAVDPPEAVLLAIPWNVCKNIHIKLLHLTHFYHIFVTMQFVAAIRQRVIGSDRWRKTVGYGKFSFNR